MMLRPRATGRTGHSARVATHSSGGEGQSHGHKSQIVQVRKGADLSCKERGHLLLQWWGQRGAWSHYFRYSSWCCACVPHCLLESCSGYGICCSSPGLKLGRFSYQGGCRSQRGTTIGTAAPSHCKREGGEPLGSPYLPKEEDYPLQVRSTTTASCKEMCCLELPLVLPSCQKGGMRK